MASLFMERICDTCIDRYQKDHKDTLMWTDRIMKKTFFYTFDPATPDFKVNICCDYSVVRPLHVYTYLFCTMSEFNA